MENRAGKELLRGVVQRQVTEGQAEMIRITNIRNENQRGIPEVEIRNDRESRLLNLRGIFSSTDKKRSVDKRKRDNSKSSADSIDPPSRNWWAILPIVFTAVTVLLELRGGWGAYHGGKNPRHPNPEKAAAKRRAQGKKYWEVFNQCILVQSFRNLTGVSGLAKSEIREAGPLTSTPPKYWLNQQIWRQIKSPIAILSGVWSNCEIKEFWRTIWNKSDMFS